MFSTSEPSNSSMTSFREPQLPLLIYTPITHVHSIRVLHPNEIISRYFRPECDNQTLIRSHNRPSVTANTSTLFPRDLPRAFEDDIMQNWFHVNCFVTLVLFEFGNCISICSRCLSLSVF